MQEGTSLVCRKAGEGSRRQGKAKIRITLLTYYYKTSLTDTTMRVWKGNLRTRDLTKTRCGNPENDKYLDGIRDLTAAREAGLAKIWPWDAGFFSPACREFGKL